MSPASRTPRKKSRLFLRILQLFALLAAIAAGLLLYAYGLLRSSLPRLDGETRIAGLATEVTITRDNLGVPTIRATSRLDAARALGYLHGQERFFQMDLSRRRAAGELSELLGEKALAEDKAIRIHALRPVAEKSIALLPPDQRAILDAYTEGVNTGLAQLGDRPFEYLLLRSQPAPWRPEDSILVIQAMAISLQNPTGIYERSLDLVREKLGPEVLAYFAPQLAPDDAALDDTTAPLPSMPGPQQLDLRRAKPAKNAPEKNAPSDTAFLTASAMPWLGEGSNSMALSGTRTATGAGMIENDMHLTLRVPNTWYRVSIICPPLDSVRSDNSALPNPQSAFPITGVTMPGTPAIIAGSNGHIAWGFTTSYADTSDLVILTPPANTPTPSDNYLTPDGKTLRIQNRTETIRVHGKGKPVTIEIPCSVWGPVIGENSQGQKLCLKWIFHDPAAANFNLIHFETATTATEAIALAHQTGIPAQNLVVADTAGNIGWTICGFLPRRTGYDGRLPVSWADGTYRWDGFVPANAIPTHINPSRGQLYTANNRLFGNAALATIGDGAPRPGQRGARIRDDLTRIENKAAPQDLLSVALDDRAEFLDRWHAQLLATLTPDATAQKPSRAALRSVLENEKWEGRATTDSASYTIVSKYRERVTARILRAVFAPCMSAYPDFNYKRFHAETAIWQIIHEQPAHLLPAPHATWNDLLLAAVDDVTREIEKEKLTPATARWGKLNTAKIRHPLSSALPAFLARRLDMPADELPGDDDVPRVQRPANGASERFIVSPGHENEGIYHMPGGQSGHPLSPYYKAGHDAWVKGTPTPFLPGATQHTLILRPASN